MLNNRGEQTSKERRGLQEALLIDNTTPAMLALRPDQFRITQTGSGVKVSSLVGDGKKRRERKRSMLNIYAINQNEEIRPKEGYIESSPDTL